MSTVLTLRLLMVDCDVVRALKSRRHGTLTPRSRESIFRDGVGQRVEHCNVRTVLFGYSTSVNLEYSKFQTPAYVVCAYENTAIHPL